MENSSEVCSSSSPSGLGFDHKKAAIAVEVVVFGLIALCSVVLNSCVILSVWFNKNLRTPLDEVITSLAVVDILTGLVAMPITVVLYRAECVFPDPIVSYWRVQLMWGFVDCFTVLSVWHVLFITMDRYVVVLHPFQYLRFKDCKRSTLVLIISCWVISTAVSLLPCLFLLDGKDEREWYLAKAAFLIYLCHGLPMAATVALNARLICYVAAEYGADGDVDGDVGLVTRKTVGHVRMSATVATALVVAYVPYLAKWQLEAWEQKSPPEYTIHPTISLGIHILMALNSLSNPVIYAFQMPAYRYIYHYVLRRFFGWKGERTASSRTVRL